MKSLENFIFCLAIVVIICLCYISMFNTYQTDDYGFAAAAKNFGAEQSAKQLYLNWGGRYFSYSLNTLNPAGNLHFNWVPKVFPLFLWANLVLGFYLNFRTYFKLKRSEAVKKSLIAFLFYTAVLTDMSEHFFWMTGALVYFLPHILTLYFLVLIRIKTPNFIQKMLIFVIIVAVMGSNEIVAIYLLLFLAIRLYYDRRSFSVVQLGIGCIFFSLLFLAPGNFVRLEVSELGFAKGILKKGGIFVANFLFVTLKIVCIAPLFIAVFYKQIVLIIEKISLKKIWLYQCFSLIALSFTGFLLLNAARTIESIILFSLLSFSVLIVCYMKNVNQWWPASLVILLMFPVSFYPYKGIYFKINYNLYSIVCEIISTDLKNFEEEIADRHKTLRSSKSDIIVLKRIRTIPKVLYFDELGNAENRNYVNQQLEAFYRKKSVVLK